MITSVLLFSLITANASILHGGDYWPKGWLVAWHATLSLACGWFGPLAVTAYWLRFRRAEQARPELDYLDGKATLHNIRAAYPLGIGYLIAPAIKSFKTRREQEFVSGLIIGLVLAIPSTFAGVFA